MYDLATIKALNQEASKKAKKEGRTPFLIESEEDKERIREIPSIGSHIPKGWVLVQRFFVDKSGLGAKDEPALTFHQFLEKVRIGFGYAIIDEGQFQVYIGEFKNI